MILIIKGLISMKDRRNVAVSFVINGLQEVERIWVIKRVAKTLSIRQINKTIVALIDVKRELEKPTKSFQDESTKSE
jgi:hypothetical protein